MTGDRAMGKNYKRSPKGEAVFDDAKRWDGWGTALKPAHEPVCFARKPLSEKTIAENVLRWATGAINVDGARISGEDLGTRDVKASNARGNALSGSVDGSLRQAWTYDGSGGRWPANVMTDGSFDVLEAFPPSARDAMRFFYSAKAGKDERDDGLTALPDASRPTMGSGIGGQPDQQRANNKNIHPTVKPVDLMRWLCRLVTPPGGVVLDPFMGSGSTGVAAIREGFQFVGCEQSRDYFEIAHARIAAAVDTAARVPDLVNAIAAEVQRMKGKQGSLF